MKNVHKSAVLLGILMLHNFFCYAESFPLFHKDGKLLPVIQRIFSLSGIKALTLEEANSAAQERFIRRGERWDAQEITDVRKKMQENKRELLNSLRELGMVDEISPKQKKYKYALLMGGLKTRVEQRLDYLMKLRQQGHVFETIVLLGGERALQPTESTGLPEDVTTEAAMMVHVCKQYDDLKEYSQLLVNAPPLVNKDGSLARPTTDSTLEHFVQIASEDGSCLVISNNPYTLRQTMAAQRILPIKRFPVDGAGFAYQENASVDIVMLMDEFARMLYEEYSAYNKSKF